MINKKKKIIICLAIILGLIAGTLVSYLVLHEKKPDRQAGTDIALFEKTGAWQGSGTQDSENFKEGKSALKLTSQGFNWTAQSDARVNLNLAVFEDPGAEMIIGVFVDDAAKISGIRLDLGDDSQTFFYFNQQTANFYQNGWNEIKVKASDFSAQGQPKGWQEIKFIRVNLAAKDDSSTVTVWFDDWRIINNTNPATTKTTQEQETAGRTNYSQWLWIAVIVVLIVLAGWLLRRVLRKKSVQEPETYLSSNKTSSAAAFLKKKIDRKWFWLLIIFVLFITIFAVIFIIISQRPKIAAANNQRAVMGVSTVNTSAPTVKDYQKCQKWEYKIISFSLPESTDEAMQAELNSLGADGWELVSQSIYYPGQTGEDLQSYVLKKCSQ